MMSSSSASTAARRAACQRARQAGRQNFAFRPRGRGVKAVPHCSQTSGALLKAAEVCVRTLSKERSATIPTPYLLCVGGRLTVCLPAEPWRLNYRAVPPENPPPESGRAAAGPLARSRPASLGAPRHGWARQPRQRPPVSGCDSSRLLASRAPTQRTYSTTGTGTGYSPTGERRARSRRLQPERRHQRSSGPVGWPAFPPRRAACAVLLRPARPWRRTSQSSHLAQPSRVRGVLVPTSVLFSNL